jgi:hypothetical protein
MRGRERESEGMQERERDRESACLSLVTAVEREKYTKERERDRDTACLTLVSDVACFSLVSCLLDAYCDAPGAGGVTSVGGGRGGGKGGCRLSAAATLV